MLMKKKLIVLVLTLTALAAALSASSQSARTCPENTYPIDCGTGNRIICCPDNAFCVC